MESVEARIICRRRMPEQGVSYAQKRVWNADCLNMSQNTCVKIGLVLFDILFSLLYNKNQIVKKHIKEREV